MVGGGIWGGHARPRSPHAHTRPGHGHLLASCGRLHRGEWVHAVRPRHPPRAEAASPCARWADWDGGGAGQPASCTHTHANPPRPTTDPPSHPLAHFAAVGGSREDSHALYTVLREGDEVVHVPIKRGSITVHNERVGGWVEGAWAAAVHSLKRESHARRPSLAHPTHPPPTHPPTGAARLWPQLLPGLAASVRAGLPHQRVHRRGAVAGLHPQPQRHRQASRARAGYCACILSHSHPDPTHPPPTPRVAGTCSTSTTSRRQKRQHDACEPPPRARVLGPSGD